MKLRLCSIALKNIVNILVICLNLLNIFAVIRIMVTNRYRYKIYKTALIVPNKTIINQCNKLIISMI